MTCIHRTHATLTLLCLLIAAVSRVGQSQDPAGVGAAKKTFTISGNVVLNNVALRGLPGNPVSRADGSYSVQVEYGWSGIVTPSKEGYSFEPPSLTYRNSPRTCQIRTTSPRYSRSRFPARPA